MAPVKAEARNKTDPIYALLALASKTKTWILKVFSIGFYAIFDVTGNKCFKVIGSQQSDRKNYTDARDDCRAQGGDIASINSHIELGRHGTTLEIEIRVMFHIKLTNKHFLFLSIITFKKC